MTTARGPIVLCATGKTGLGHLRRLTNVAAELRRQAPSRPLRLITNAPIAGLSPDEESFFEATTSAARDEMTEAIRQLEPTQVVVDTAEIPGLHFVEARLSLILRETVPDKLHRFTLADERRWDLVLLPHPADDWSPDPDKVPARTIHSVGWIYRANHTSVLRRQVSNTRTVLVASGGGGNSETAADFRNEVDQVVARARAACDKPLHVLQCLGPRAPDVARLATADEIVSPGAHLNALFPEADAVISTVGYNSMLELAVADVPTLLVPIARSIDDQTSRAQRWGTKIGWCHDKKRPEASSAWLAHCLTQRDRRLPVGLGRSGARDAAAHILALS